MFSSSLATTASINLWLSLRCLWPRGSASNFHKSTYLAGFAKKHLLASQDRHHYHKNVSRKIEGNWGENVRFFTHQQSSASHDQISGNSIRKAEYSMSMMAITWGPVPRFVVYEKKMGKPGNSPARSLFSVDCPNRHLKGTTEAFTTPARRYTVASSSIGHYTHSIEEAFIIWWWPIKHGYHGQMNRVVHKNPPFIGAPSSSFESMKLFLWGKPIEICRLLILV